MPRDGRKRREVGVLGHGVGADQHTLGAQPDRVRATFRRGNDAASSRPRTQSISVQPSVAPSALVIPETRNRRPASSFVAIRPRRAEAQPPPSTPPNATHLPPDATNSARLAPGVPKSPPDWTRGMQRRIVI